MIVLVGMIVMIIPLFITLWIVGKRQFGQITRKLNKKEYPFKDFMGIGLFILEKSNYSYQTKYDKKMIKKFEGLYGVKNACNYYQWYLGEKIAFCLLLIFDFTLLSLIFLMQSYNSSYHMVEHVFLREKDMDHMVPITLVLENQDNKIERDIQLVVPKMDDTYKDMEERVHQVKHRLNNQLDQMAELNHSIQFPEVINGVNIKWKTSHPIIDSSGNINFEEVPEEGISIHLTATLSYLEYSDTIESSHRIMPEIQQPKSLEALAIEIEEGLYAGKYTSDKAIQLPLSLSNESVQISWKEKEDSEAIEFFSFGILIAFFVFFVRDEDIKRKIKKKDDLIKLQFPDMVIKFTLLINAGMTSFCAWNKVCMDYMKKKEGDEQEMPMYEEMLITLCDMKGGLSEYDAYERFGQRIRVREVKKFSNMLTQTLRKGNTDLVISLQNLGQEAWEERVATAKRLGEEASSKLLFPMMILLIIIIIIVMTPALMSLNI